MVKMKGTYTRYKDKKTNKSKKKQLKKLHEEMPVDETNQAGDVENESEEEMANDKEEEKQMTVGKTKLIFKEKEKKTREYIKALMKKRQQLNKKDLKCRDERKDITKEIKTLREQLDKDKQEHLSQFTKQDNNPSVD